MARAIGLVWLGIACACGAGGDAPEVGATGGEPQQSEERTDEPQNRGPVRYLTRRELALPGKPRGVEAFAVPREGGAEEGLLVALEDPGAVLWFVREEGLVLERRFEVGAWPLGPIDLGAGRFAVASQAERRLERFDVTQGGVEPYAVDELPDVPEALDVADDGTVYVVGRHVLLSVFGPGAEPRHVRLSGERATTLLPSYLGLYVATQVPRALWHYPHAQLADDRVDWTVDRKDVQGIPRALSEIELDEHPGAELVVAGGDEQLWIYGAGLPSPPFSDARTIVPVRAPGHVPLVLEAADLDGDGHDELLGLFRYDTSYGVLGGYDAEQHSFALDTSEYAGQSPVDLACLDVDGDARLDLAIANRDAQSIGLLSGVGLASPGKDPFYNARRIAVGANPLFATAADLDGDGFPEGVALLGAEASVRVLRNDGFGYLSAAETIEVGPSPRRAVPCDLDGDGRRDLAVLCEPTDGSRLVWLRGGENGDLSPAGAPLVVGRSNGLAALGEGELLLTDPSAAGARRVRVGSVGELEVDAFALPAPASAVVADPATGQVALGLAGDTPELALGRAGASFTPDARTELSGLALDLALGDANGDGRLDVFALVSRSADHKRAVVELWLASEGELSLGARAEAGLKPIQLAAGDGDDDGLADVFVAAQNSHQVQLFATREGGRRLAPQPDLGAGLGCFSVCLADLSGNGLLDVLVANAFSGDVSCVYAVR